MVKTVATKPSKSGKDTEKKSTKKVDAKADAKVKSTKTAKTSTKADKDEPVKRGPGRPRKDEAPVKPAAKTTKKVAAKDEKPAKKAAKADVKTAKKSEKKTPAKKAKK